MLKLFFITFFTAELIIAIAVILRLYIFDKSVVELNDFITENQYKVKVVFMGTRLFLKEITQTIIDVKELIDEKRKEYIAKMLKTVLIYSGIFLLKGKYRKTFITCQIAKEIYDGFQED